MKLFLYKYVLPLFGFTILKILAATYRIETIGDDNEKSIRAGKDFPIYACWHQRFFPGIDYLSNRKPIAIIISMSRDGDLIAGISKLSGWYPVRGSSSKGGARALKEIKSLASKGYSIGHIVDGPRGPSEIVKPGIIFLAKHTAMPILPVIISAKNKWVFKSWDRFIIPKPFTRVKIKFDKELRVPGDSGKEELENYRAGLEKRLKIAYHELDKAWS